METLSALLAFVRIIHRSLVNSPHKGQWGGALMFSLICPWINGWVNNREAGDLRCHHAHYDITVMKMWVLGSLYWTYEIRSCRIRSYGGCAWDMIPWWQWWVPHLGSDKMAALCRKYFQIHFLACKLLYFDSNFTEVCSWGVIDNKSPLFQVMVWCRIGDKPLS